MSSLRLVFTIVFLIPAVGTSLQASDPGDYTIRSNVNEVRVLFHGLDRQGNRITQLAPTDVAVVDNDEVIRRFRSFSPASETPLRVVVLVDISDSVSKETAAELELVKAFVRSADWRPGDQVSVLVFSGGEVTELCRADCRERPFSVPARNMGSTTPLYDALVAASELLSQSQNGESRAAIALVSDGLDTVSRYGLSDAISAAQAAEASVYTLNSRGKRADGRGDDTLEEIAAETGGVAYPPGKGTAQALNGVLADLRQGFVLTYELPHSSGARHELRVVPALNSSLRFRSRHGYADSRGAQ